MSMLAVDETERLGAVELGATLERRVRFLPQRDRKMLELSLLGRLTRREAAVFWGVTPGGATRRLRRLMRLLHDPLVVALMERGELLPEMHREVGLAFFLWGWRVPRIARELGVSPYAVRGMLKYVRTWGEEVRSQKSEARSRKSVVNGQR